MTAPYWTDGAVSLYLGDCREVLPALGITADCIVADPPYGETSHKWDRWPDGWVRMAADTARSMWCFGSLRMLLTHAADFTWDNRETGRYPWRMSQDVVWAKNIVTSMHTDRFARRHELLTHWYRGSWSDIYANTPRDRWYGPRRTMSPGNGVVGSQRGDYPRTQWVDDGTRLAGSVLEVRAMFRHGGHPTEKPLGLLDPLITYACPPDGLVLDPFAGSGSALAAARASGRRAIGIEVNESYCEMAARRLSQSDLFAEETTA